METALRAKRDAGRKLLVPYVTGGLGDDWLDTVRAVDRLLTARLQRESADRDIRFVRVDAWSEQKTRKVQTV